MNKICFYIFFGLCILVTAVSVHAQPGLYAGAGSNIFIRSGTIFSLDSLVLTPSSDFNLQGINAIDKTTTLLHGSANPFIKRVFQFTNSTAPFTGNIAIYYRDNELNGIAESNLTLNIHNGSNWNHFNSNVTRDAVNNLVNTANVAGVVLNELTLASLLAPLPVKFLSLNVICQTGTVLVRWQTAIEVNTRRFEVQWSGDGVAWQAVGNIAAAGNSSALLSYVYQANPPAGNGWFRIVEYDADGRSTISAVIKSTCSLSAGIAVYPNPVSETAYLSIPSAVTSPVLIKLYDTRGALVKSMQHALSPGTNVLTVNMQGLAAGWYSLNLLYGGNTSQFTLLKQ